MTICAGIGCDAALPPSIGTRERKWCSERCRKRSYGDPCVDCGTRTAFGAEQARVEEPRCQTCAMDHRRVWTWNVIVERIREWAAMYGEAPAAPDWNPHHARHVIHDERRARRFEDAGGYWPHHTTVYRVMGSWSGALEVAGFDARPAHGGGGNFARRRSQKVAA